MSATTSSEPLGKEDLQKDKVIELRGRLSELEVQLSGEERQTRWYKGFAAATMLIVMFAFLRGLSTWWEAGSIVLALLGVAGLGGHIDGIYKIRGQIERCKSELSILEELPLSAKTDSASYFQNLVTINVSNLKEYYFLVKQHTNWSFRAAMSAGIVGFLLISIGLGFSYAQNARDSSVYIATGAGVITEFVSGVFFFLYNKTVRQLKGYHDSLLRVQNVLLSLKLLESVSDSALRAPMISTMLEFLMRSSDVHYDKDSGAAAT